VFFNDKCFKFRHFSIFESPNVAIIEVFIFPGFIFQLDFPGHHNIIALLNRLFQFEIAGLTGTPAEAINVSRINECPVQMEAVVMGMHKLAEDEPLQHGKIITFELKINRVFLDKSITMDNHPNRVDPDKWKPLIMSFQEFYTLGNKVHESTLAEIPENLYNTYDRKSTQAED